MKKILLSLTIVLLTIITSIAQNFEWAKSFGSTATDSGKLITTDASGNIYVTGLFSGTVDFNPGTGISELTANPSNVDAFIQKLDGDGNFIWAKSIFGNYQENITSIAVDVSGNVYITGNFVGTVDFDPGSSTFLLTSTGQTDIFVLKLDAVGDFLWAKSFGDVNGDSGNSIVTDDLGNIYIAGTFQNSIDFEGIGNFINSNSGYATDGFILKLDTNGNYIWVKTMGDIQNDSCNSVNLDTSGNIYVTGFFSGTVDFDPGTGTYNLTANAPINGRDFYFLKLDNNGDFLWANSIFGNSDLYITDTDIDGSGNTYYTGVFGGTVDFNPGSETNDHNSGSTTDNFILKLDVNGGFLWVKIFGNEELAHSSRLAVDHSGNVYTTAGFRYTMDLDPGPGIYDVSVLYVPGQVQWGSFIQKLNASGNLLGAKSITGATFPDIAVDNSDNIYTTGSFSNGPFDFDPGADTFNMTSVGSSDVFIHKMSPSCYTAPGIDTQLACNSFIWIDGYTYIASNNTATHTIIGGATNGCDSVVTLNLTVNIVSSISIDVTVNNNILTAIQSGATYQWIDCDNGNTPIAGETGQSFTPTSNGVYAVEITLSGCAYMSSCYAVSNLSIHEINDSFIQIYPSPANTILNIDISTTLNAEESTNITIVNILGATVATQQLKTGNNTIDVGHLTSGVYFITTETGASIKFVKE
jgi:hypothetical protein